MVFGMSRRSCAAFPSVEDQSTICESAGCPQLCLASGCFSIRPQLRLGFYVSNKAGRNKKPRHATEAQRFGAGIGAGAGFPATPYGVRIPAAPPTAESQFSMAEANRKNVNGQRPPGGSFPNSVEAEQAVFGCVLLASDVFPEVALCLTAASFHDLRHQTIFLACEMLHRLGIAIDVVTLSQNLRDAGKLEDVGGLAYVSSLPDKAPSANSVDHYVSIVAEKQRLRDLAARSANISRAASEPGADVAAIEEDLKIAADEFTAGNGQQVRGRSLGEILPPSQDDGSELLKNRFLCRGGGMLLVGQSGQGKSSLASQLATNWGLLRIA